ncbi:MAG: hypothetical protein LK562_11020, partial [Candidatus Accumulibacter phosphatis]|nr:hypothetical protein [Candidatus Accumulibacter phosphatis]
NVDPVRGSQKKELAMAVKGKAGRAALVETEGASVSGRQGIHCTPYTLRNRRRRGSRSLRLHARGE